MVNRITEGDEEEEIKSDNFQKFNTMKDEAKLKKIIKEEMYF